MTHFPADTLTRQSQNAEFRAMREIYGEKVDPALQDVLRRKQFLTLKERSKAGDTFGTKLLLASMTGHFGIENIEHFNEIWTQIWCETRLKRGLEV